MQLPIAIILSVAFLPAGVHAETLRRSAKVPIAPPLTLQKSFYREETRRGTCHETQCRNETGPVAREVCKDESNFRDVCRNDFVCEPDANNEGQQSCQWKQVCSSEWVNDRVCHTERVDETDRVCEDMPFDCEVSKKVLDRKWSVILTSSFDASALLPKNRDEKIDVQLAGDERNPQLKVKVLRSPFKYNVDFRFASDAKTASVEFKLP